MDDEKTIKVDYLARVEGEGAFHVKIKNDKVQEAKLNIFEPPRFFEAFLRDRIITEAPDITARICGICPVAYQMSSTHAIEKALGINVDAPIRNLRRLLYCGEWIESHSLHVYFLHAPDFLGMQDALEIAKVHPEVVKNALKLKKAGNAIVKLVGGREIHPINVKIGGFYKSIEIKQMDELQRNLKDVKQITYDTLQFCSTLEFPDYEQDYTFVSLRHEDEYPMNEGRLVSNKGLDIDSDQYEDYFQETHMPHSTTLHSTLNNDLFFTGPLARFNLNFDKLPEALQKLALKSGLERNCKNPFKSILVRSVELIYAVEEAIRIIDEYKKPDMPSVSYKMKAAEGSAITEAPRGILYHRYLFDEKGLIRDAKIVAPTSHNQKIMEHDLFHLAQKFVDLPEEELTWKCEQTIRNYDPCISCATHFLKLDIDRS
ncbi:MAG: Ni/Fe hydrogenase subunit alpha [Leptospirales bacterium]